MVIVVEGKNDYNKIKTVFPDANVLITNGSSIDNEFLNLLKNLSNNHKIILCLDPDFEGDRIRRKIFEVVPCAYHVYANRMDAKSRNGKKIGIEHMKVGDIQNLFNNIKIPNKQSNINETQLYELGLSGHPKSKELRKRIGNDLGIGYANAKQFVNKINMFNISIEELKRYL